MFRSRTPWTTSIMFPQSSPMLVTFWPSLGVRPRRQLLESRTVVVFPRDLVVDPPAVQLDELSALTRQLSAVFGEIELAVEGCNVLVGRLRDQFQRVEQVAVEVLIDER